MAILTVEGRVENGQIRLRENVVLPECFPFSVSIWRDESGPPVHVASRFPPSSTRPNPPR